MSYAVNIPVASIGQSTTCFACGIRLPSLETQQMHHKSDWHTYNLKRKMASMPPVSADVFSQLVAASREQANPAEVPQPECVPCGKKYLSLQAYDNHLNSKKHKQVAVAYAKKQENRPTQEDTASPSATETTATTTTSETKTTTAKEPVEQCEPSETVCLFCSHKASDAESNYAHMRSAHGFFLPSFERLIDLPGMLSYLAEKVVQDYDCLWCTPSVFSQNLKPDQELNAGFASLTSVRRHMIDKGHCKLAMDRGAEREYSDFYLPQDISEDEDEGDDGNSSNKHREHLEDSSMDTDDEILDEDAKRLNQVLLDESGNWILDTDNAHFSGIKVDPLTNELILNNRRLAHKDAARRQKVESRTVILSSRSQHRSSPSSASSAAAETDNNGESAEAEAEGRDVPTSNALLKSQNQLKGSSLSLRSDQLNHVALKNARAQDFESTKRERMSTKLATSNNSTQRIRYAGTYGTKV
ncbi:hypothetical protein BG011_004751 [Mortierella polycephala]|uniref:C2H2-type domain-containing protein n=1 Tax=Mortierella polycephala TaxID=41804 RepID=A0A9P6Q0X9_9FUNG|nr:hypothetical protein BG011_004751 [Mortierella polycephala]